MNKISNQSDKETGNEEKKNNGMFTNIKFMIIRIMKFNFFLRQY